MGLLANYVVEDEVAAHAMAIKKEWQSRERRFDSLYKHPYVIH
jgi:hypothetical protein